MEDGSEGGPTWSTLDTSSLFKTNPHLLDTEWPSNDHQRKRSSHLLHLLMCILHKIHTLCQHWKGCSFVIYEWRMRSTTVNGESQQFLSLQKATVISSEGSAKDSEQGQQLNVKFFSYTSSGCPDRGAKKLSVIHHRKKYNSHMMFLSMVPLDDHCSWPSRLYPITASESPEYCPWGRTRRENHICSTRDRATAKGCLSLEITWTKKTGKKN